MKFGNFLFPDCRDPARDGAVIDETLREAWLSDELGVDVIWLAAHDEKRRGPTGLSFAPVYSFTAAIAHMARGQERQSIIDALPGQSVIDGVGTLSLLASAELIGRAQAIVTNDSAPQHLASAMGTPTLAIFGPTVPEFGFGPLAERKAVAGHTGLSCRPCDRHGPQRCPLGHWRCMRELSPDYVASLLTEVLNPPVPV